MRGLSSAYAQQVVPTAFERWLKANDLERIYQAMPSSTN